MDDTNKQPSRGWLRHVPVVGERLADRLERAPTVAVLRLSGVIDAARFARPGAGPNLADMAGPIGAAFKLKRLKAVALAVNSPGGSPVQSALIAGRIRQLAEENEVPVYAFCEDAAASGGYWLACAADTIYAQPASVIGSIGVISAGFGFDEAIKRLGVDRRVYTAGDVKSQLDPFQPEKREDIKRLRALQDDIHGQFKDWVRTRRGDRLKEDSPELFEGAFWTGNRALEMGLVDGLGDIRSVMRAEFGESVRLRLVEKPKGLLQRRLGLGVRGGDGAEVGAGLSRGLLAAADEQAWWARLGL